MNAITVCVEYSDLLAITLPFNRFHFDRFMVVTSHKDKETMRIAIDNGADVHMTPAFYEDGALFNKWKALEEGLDRLGRSGWLCILDADIILPRGYIGNSGFEFGNLYTPTRRIVPQAAINAELHLGTFRVPSLWNAYSQYTDTEWAGYTQIFHAEDWHLLEPPWHEQDWKHAGGADSAFQALWPQEHKRRPPWEVLHLGHPGMNWAGRTTKMLDGTLPQDAQIRSQSLRQMMMLRSVNRNYSAEKIKPE